MIFKKKGKKGSFTSLGIDGVKYKGNRTRFLAGFTLIELLVAISIVGILSAVVLTSMSGPRNRANDAKRISDIKQIQMALELAYDVAKAYPASIYGAELADFLNVSNDPTTGNPYFYSGGGQTYHLGANLQEPNSLLSDDDDDATGFDGVSNDCAGGAGVDGCYDVTP